MSEHKITVTLDCQDRQAEMRKEQVLKKIRADRTTQLRLEAAQSARECFEALKKHSPFSFTVFNFIYQVAIAHALQAHSMVGGKPPAPGSAEEKSLVRDISMQVAAVLQACGGMLPPKGLAIEALDESNGQKYHHMLRASSAKG